MHKLALAVATVFVVAISAAGIASGSGPVVLDEGFDCNVLDGNGTPFVTTDSELILYDSGKVVLRCEGTGAPAPSLTHFNFGNTGAVCDIPGYGVTEDWDDKVGRAGNSQLTCTTSTEVVTTLAASSGAAGIAR